MYLQIINIYRSLWGFDVPPIGLSSPVQLYTCPYRLVISLYDVYILITNTCHQHSSLTLCFAWIYNMKHTRSTGTYTCLYAVMATLYNVWPTGRAARVLGTKMIPSTMFCQGTDFCMDNPPQYHNIGVLGNSVPFNPGSGGRSAGYGDIHW